jgi:dGTPase
LIRFLISHFINDIISNSLLKLNKANFKSVNEIRLYHEPVITMTSKSIDYMEEIREFLFKNMYRNTKILNELSKASEMIEKLFFLYSKNINLLPKQWRIFNGNCLLDSPDNVRSRVIADYIAGMTDNFLRKEYKKIFKEE